MSAFMVGSDHIEAMVSLALNGPRGVEVSPSHAWSMSWRRDVDEYEPYPEMCPGVVSTIQWAKPIAFESLRSRSEEMTADELGGMLWAENAKSIRHRYDDADEAHMLDQFYAGYEHNQRRAGMYQPTAVEGLKLLDCYEYQTCEHPEWHGSEAQRFCESLRSLLVHRLSGYDEAPWEWEYAR